MTRTAQAVNRTRTGRGVALPLGVELLGVFDQAQEAVVDLHSVHHAGHMHLYPLSRFEHITALPREARQRTHGQYVQILLGDDDDDDEWRHQSGR